MNTPQPIASTPLFREYAALLAQAASLGASRYPQDQAVSFMLREQCTAFLKDHPAIEVGIKEVGTRMQERAKAARDLDRERAKAWGPKKWEEWHVRALAIEKEYQAAGTYGRASMEATELAWLRSTYAPSIPCGPCRAHFLDFLRQMPVRLADYFTYTVEFHNAVSATIGLTSMAVDDARARWSS